MTQFRGILTQFVTLNTLNKNEFSINNKILLQIAAKCGNTLYLPKSKYFSFGGGVMLIGFGDVASNDGRILAITGTMNLTYSEFYSTARHYTKP